MFTKANTNAFYNDLRGKILLIKYIKENISKMTLSLLVYALLKLCCSIYTKKPLFYIFKLH